MNVNEEQLDAYIAGELDDEAAALVESLVAADVVLQEEVYTQARMDQALRWLFLEEAGCGVDEEGAGETLLLSDALPVDEFAAGVMASLTSGDEESLARSVLTELLEDQEKKKRPHAWWDLAKAVAVAAVAALVTVLVLKSVEVSDEEFATQRQAVEEARLLAQVTREVDARWGEHTSVTRDGSWLSAGLLHLESGLAEVTFDNGARTILEGPCHLDIETPQRAFLRRGRITVEVPEPAVGFVINTPSMNVVDLGTRFGVDVLANGTSEVHVMEGEVEATRSEGRAVPMLLREGLAVRADHRTRSHLQSIEYGGDRFALRAGDAVLPPAPRVRYRFDENVGPVLEDSGSGFAGGAFEGSLMTPSDSFGNDLPTPLRSAGRSGSGLLFRKGESLATPMPTELQEQAPHTVAFWVKLPPTGLTGAKRQHSTVLALGGKDDAAPGDGESSGKVSAGSPGGWRLSSNADSSAGPVGALRIDYGDGFVIGTTDLRDGLWHHVATRFAGASLVDNGQTRGGGGGRSGAAPGADIATHVRLFVDGKLDPIASVQRQMVKPVPSNSSSAIYLTLGRSLNGEAAGFEGVIDDLVVCLGSLSPVEIFEMAQSGADRARD